MWSHPSLSTVLSSQVCRCVHTYVCFNICSYLSPRPQPQHSKTTHVRSYWHAIHKQHVHMLHRNHLGPLQRWEIPFSVYSRTSAGCAVSPQLLRSELTVNWATAEAEAEAAHFSSEWRILRLETPYTTHPFIYLSISLCCLPEPAGPWAHGTNLATQERGTHTRREGVRVRLRAGWGERCCCLPAHSVIPSSCGYCKWDGDEEWENGTTVSP